MECHYVFIIFDARTGTPRTGVTANLQKIIERSKRECRRAAATPRLLYYEVTDAEHTALARERQIRRWCIERQLALIASMNPQWDDLSTKW